MKYEVLVTVGLALSMAFAEPGSKTTMLEGYRVRVVRNGEIAETPGTGGTKGTINYNGRTVAADDSNYGESIPAALLEDGATIRVTSGTSVWPMIVMTNGTATVETVSGARLNFCRSVLLRGGAHLIVKGSSLLSVGCGHENFAPYYELDGVTVKRGETDITGSIHFSDLARVVSLPSAWVGNFVWDADLDSGTVYLLGDVYRDVTGVIGAFPGTNVYFQSPAFINGHDVKIDSAVTLHLEPFTITSPRVTLADHLAEVDTVGTQVSFDLPGTNYCFNANLNNAAAVLSLDADAPAARTESGSFSGTVTGIGTVKAAFGSGATPTAPKTLTMSGDLSGFAGMVAVECANANLSETPAGTLVVSNINANVKALVGANARILFAPDVAAVSVREVSGTAVSGSFGTTAGRTLTVGTLSGRIRAAGDGAIVCAAVAPDTTLANDAAVTYPASVRATALNDAGVRVASRFADATGRTVDVGALVAALDDTTVRYRTVGATEGARLVNVPAGTILEAEAQFLVEAATSDVFLHGAGTLVFDHGGTQGWTNSVDFWFDFSRTDTFRGVSYAADTPDSAKLNMTYSYGGRTCPVLERCVDWRYPDREGTLWQGLYYVAPGSAYSQYYPLAATNMYTHVPGMTYMTFADKTTGRLPFCFSKNKANDGEQVRMQYVVMVYSSRLGGGESLVADQNAYFRRQCKADANDSIHPFVMNALPNGLSIRADGREVADPTVTCPNGDWQIVTLKMNGESFRGFGYYGPNKTNGGGQSEYGEVMLFTNAVPISCVLQAERYLARKWNISAYDENDLKAAIADEIASTTNVVSGVGASAARILSGGYATVRVAGDFAGEIALDGGRLVVDAMRPWSEEQVAAVGNRCFWLDADDRSSLLLLEDYRTEPLSDLAKTQVRVVKNKTDADFRSAPVMAGLSNRMPYLRREACRFGPERGWLDFYEWSGDGGGNTLRMVEPYQWGWDSIANNPHTNSVQTILMAHNSTWGGGTPINDSTASDGHFGIRYGTDPKAPVWRKGNGSLDCAEFRNGLNRIDAVTQVNPNGFGGQAEVYAVRGTGPIETQYYVDNYQSSQVASDRRTACVGEILYYSTALDDATIAGIESYLMQKWLGLLPSGYGDVHRATVTGSGTIEAASLAQLPIVASDFSGTVRVDGSAGETTMTIDASTKQVEGALVNTGATFELPATVTIRVKFADSPERRAKNRYLLVDAAGAGNANWTVDLSDPSVPHTASVVREGDKIFVSVDVLGMTVIVR